MDKKKQLLYAGVAVVVAGIVYLLWKRSQSAGPVVADYSGNLPGLVSTSPAAATFTPDLSPVTGAPIAPWSAPAAPSAVGGGGNSSCCGCGTSANSNSLYYGSPQDIAAAYAAIAPAAANSNPVPTVAPSSTGPVSIGSFLANIFSGGGVATPAAGKPMAYSGNVMFQGVAGGAIPGL